MLCSPPPAMRGLVRQGITTAVFLGAFGLFAAARAGDDLLDEEPTTSEATEAGQAERASPGDTAPVSDEAVGSEAAKQHAQLFVETKYPSATVCRTCHPEHYREWAMSQHAYSQISPTLQAMQG